MGRKRKMPSRKAIFNYWKDKLDNAKDDNTCFKCGVTSILDKDSVIVDRAHIKAVCEGGSDDVSNIHLLCRSCHRDSEGYDGDVYDLFMLSKHKVEFSESLCVLWFFNEIKIPKLLDDKFTQITKHYKDNSGELMLDLQVYSAARTNKDLILRYLKDKSKVDDRLMEYITWDKKVSHSFEK